MTCYYYRNNIRIARRKIIHFFLYWKTKWPEKKKFYHRGNTNFDHMLSPELKNKLSEKKKKLSKQITLMNKYHNIRRKKKKNQRIRKMGGSNGKWKYRVQEGSRNNLPQKWRETWKKYKWKDPVDITVRDVEGETENKHKEVEIKQL